MSGPAAPSARATCDTDDLLAHYEELRRAVLGARSRALGAGLGVLVRRGMAAWMMACSSVGGQAVDAPQAHNSVEAGMPQALQGEIVTLLAGMALGSMQEVTA